MEAKMKHLMETVARKDRELANAKVETAKFQALMKKDLEKIKKMSLQYQPNPNTDKKVKEQQAQLEAMQKENQKYKMKLKTLMIEGQKHREPKAGTPAPEEKSPEKKGSSDPKRELRVVRPAGKLVTNANNKTEIKPFDDKRKSKPERRTSEEESTEKMEVDSSEEKSNTNGDNGSSEEESKLSSEEKNEEKAKTKADGPEEKSKDRNEGKSEEGKIKSKSNVQSMEEELKNKMGVKSIEDKLKFGKTVNISPKTIKLVKLEKLTTSESVAKTNQIESELKNKAANEEEAKKSTFVKKSSTKEKDMSKEDKGKSHNSEDTEDGESEKPLTRMTKSSVHTKKNEKGIVSKKNVPVLKIR